MTATASTQAEWFSNYVSATMSILGVHAPDDRGDLPIHGDTSRGWVHVSYTEPWSVRVVALAASDVPAKLAVLKELNAVNLAVRGVRVTLNGKGRVYVDQRVLADAVGTTTLRHAIAEVLAVADDVGLMLATVHGGTTPIAPSAA